MILVGTSDELCIVDSGMEASRERYQLVLVNVMSYRSSLVLLCSEQM